MDENRASIYEYLTVEKECEEQRTLDTGTNWEFDNLGQSNSCIHVEIYNIDETYVKVIAFDFSM